MSISDILVGVNSSALDVPLNHTNWLLDYKINGQKSYVYKDKDILHELYCSPISANDEDVQIDAFNYLASELEPYLGLWLSKNYGLRDLTNLPNCKTLSSMIDDSAILNRIVNSEFSTSFFALDVVLAYFTTTDGLKAAYQNDDVMTTLESLDSFKTAIASNYATTDGLKAVSQDDDIMTILESLDCFKSAVASNPNKKTVNMTIPYEKSNTLTNAFIISVNAGCAYAEGIWLKGAVTYTPHGSTDNMTLIGSTWSGTRVESESRTVNKFVKSLTINGPISFNGLDIKTSNSVTYIQLDNVV